MALQALMADRDLWDHSEAILLLLWPESHILQQMEPSILQVLLMLLMAHSITCLEIAGSIMTTVMAATDLRIL